MQTRLHRQLACAGQSVPWCILTGGDRKTNLAKELRRSRNFAIGLNMKFDHAKTQPIAQ
jgi:hypothetical protein